MEMKMEMKIDNGTLEVSELKKLLKFEKGLLEVEIVKQDPINDGLVSYAALIVARLYYKGGSLVVPFIHYAGENWLFTPLDWQDPCFDSMFKVGDIDNVTWRVNNTCQEGVFWSGLPRLIA